MAATIEASGGRKPPEHRIPPVVRNIAAGTILTVAAVGAVVAGVRGLGGESKSSSDHSGTTTSAPKQENPPKHEVTLAFKKFPDAQFPSADGQTINLQNYFKQHEYTFVSLTSEENTGFGPFRILEDLKAEFSNQDTQLLGINVLEPPEKVTKNLGLNQQRYGKFTFPITIDASNNTDPQRLTKKLDLQGYPITYLVNKNGEIVASYLGTIQTPLDKKRLIRTFQTAFKIPHPEITRAQFTKYLDENPQIKLDRSCNNCGYGINYSKNTGEIEITIVQGAAGKYGTPDQLEQAYQNALAWIFDQGIDPDTLKIKVIR